MNRVNAIKRIIASRFNGKQVDFAAAIGKKPSQVNHWLTGVRNVGEKAAREIEFALGLSHGELDQDLDSIQERRRRIAVSQYNAETGVTTNKSYEFIDDDGEVHFLLEYDNGEVNVIQIEDEHPELPLSEKALSMIRAIIKNDIKK